MTKLDQYRGCLLAGAVGDALGYQVEFDTLKRIIAEHGPRGVRVLCPIISDDTQMTLFTAEGMLAGLRHGMPMEAAVYQSYLDWYRTQGGSAQGMFSGESELLKLQRLHVRRAPGGTCLTALGSGNMGTMTRALNNSKGCGGVMRTAPCGLLKMMDAADPEEAYALQGGAAAAITHSHPMGYVPAAMLADMVHRIVQEESDSLKEVVLSSLERIMRVFAREMDCAPQMMQAFRQLMLRAVELAEQDLPDTEAIAILGEGWVGDEALAIAVYCALKHVDSVEDCLSAAVTHKGDSDSTGAIAGNILGAWLGEDAIPAQWRTEVELADVVTGMADQLFAAAQ